MRSKSSIYSDMSHIRQLDWPNWNNKYNYFSILSHLSHDVWISLSWRVFDIFSYLQISYLKYVQLDISHTDSSRGRGAVKHRIHNQRDFDLIRSSN